MQRHIRTIIIISISIIRTRIADTVHTTTTTVGTGTTAAGHHGRNGIGTCISNIIYIMTSIGTAVRIKLHTVAAVVLVVVYNYRW